MRSPLNCIRRSPPGGTEPPFAIKHGEAHLPDPYARFPERHAEIDEFLQVSGRITKRFPLFVLSKAMPRWLRKLWQRFVLGETWQRYAGRSLKAVLDEILVDTDNGEVTGVRMADQTVIPCKRVVSSVGYHNTFGKLLPEQVTTRIDMPRRLPVGSS